MEVIYWDVWPSVERSRPFLSYDYTQIRWLILTKLCTSFQAGTRVFIFFVSFSKWQPLIKISGSLGLMTEEYLLWRLYLVRQRSAEPCSFRLTRRQPRLRKTKATFCAPEVAEVTLTFGTHDWLCPTTQRSFYHPPILWISTYSLTHIRQTVSTHPYFYHSPIIWTPNHSSA